VRKKDGKVLKVLFLFGNYCQVMDFNKFLWWCQHNHTLFNYKIFSSILILLLKIVHANQVLCALFLVATSECAAWRFQQLMLAILHSLGMQFLMKLYSSWSHSSLFLNQKVSQVHYHFIFIIIWHTSTASFSLKVDLISYFNNCILMFALFIIAIIFVDESRTNEKHRNRKF
jgi:hypothetical protein